MIRHQEHSVSTNPEKYNKNVKSVNFASFMRPSSKLGPGKIEILAIEFIELEAGS